MPRVDFDAERTYDDAKFSAEAVHRSESSKVICGYFEPGQFIPVHAPESDITVVVRSGNGIVRDGDTEHEVEPGDVVVVEADTDRGIKADRDNRLETLMVVSPPPTDAEHAPVREGLRKGQFDPGTETARE
jgi:quercetin dioxygenase-like cupin family protein